MDATCFRTSMMVSARCSRWVNRVESALASRSFRHAVRCEEDKPSRRSSYASPESKSS